MGLRLGWDGFAMGAGRGEERCDNDRPTGRLHAKRSAPAAARVWELKEEAGASVPASHLTSFVRCAIGTCARGVPTHDSPGGRWRGGDPPVGRFCVTSTYPWVGLGSRNGAVQRWSDAHVGRLRLLRRFELQ